MLEMASRRPIQGSRFPPVPFLDPPPRRLREPDRPLILAAPAAPPPSLPTHWPDLPPLLHAGPGPATGPPRGRGGVGRGGQAGGAARGQGRGGGRAQPGGPFQRRVGAAQRRAAPPRPDRPPPPRPAPGLPPAPAELACPGRGRLARDQPNRSVERYFSPVSGASVTISEPGGASAASLSAAATFAPAEKPVRIPSLVASRRAVSTASWSVTLRKPSQSAGSQSGGDSAWPGPPLRGLGLLTVPPAPEGRPARPAAPAPIARVARLGAPAGPPNRPP